MMEFGKRTVPRYSPIYTCTNIIVQVFLKISLAPMAQTWSLSM